MDTLDTSSFAKSHKAHTGVTGSKKITTMKEHKGSMNDELYIIKLSDKEGEQGFQIKPKHGQTEFILKAIQIEKKPNQNNVFAIKLVKQ